MTYRQVKWRVSGLPLALFTVLWAFLYLPNLRTNPGWFIEETSALETALNLLKGIPAYFATWNTYFHPVAPFQPGYLFLTGCFAQGDIWGARLFNALLALGIAFMIYLLGKRSFDSSAASFSAALLFLVYEQSIVQFRSVFPHNGVAFGTTLAALYLMRPPRLKYDLLAGVGIMIAAASHPTFAYGALAAFFVRFQKPKSWIFLFAPTMIYFLVVIAWLYSKFNNWVFEDIQTLFLWYRESCVQSIGALCENILNFYTQDWMHLGGFAGILCCFPRKFYRLGIFIIVVSLFFLKENTDATIYYFQVVTLLPLMCLCWGAIVVRVNHLFRNVYQYNLMLLVVLLIVAFCVGKVLIPLWEGSLQTRDNRSSMQSIDNLEAAVKWVDAHTIPENLVIANPNVIWLLHTQTARYRQSAAWMGLPAMSYERHINHKRFRYDASLERAKFVVIGYEDLHWDPSLRNLKFLFEQMQKERWITVWKSTYYTIFENPKYLPPSLPR